MIKTASFEFKLKMWTNQELTPSYGQPVPATVGTNWPR
jgi:hypothetical protein